MRGQGQREKEATPTRRAHRQKQARARTIERLNGNGHDAVPSGSPDPVLRQARRPPVPSGGGQKPITGDSALPLSLGGGGPGPHSYPHHSQGNPLAIVMLEHDHKESPLYHSLTLYPPLNLDHSIAAIHPWSLLYTPHLNLSLTLTSLIPAPFRGRDIFSLMPHQLRIGGLDRQQSVAPLCGSLGCPWRLALLLG